MDGMWELFFATGLPQAYLAARREKPQGRSEPTLPPRNGETISSMPPPWQLDCGPLRLERAHRT